MATEPIREVLGRALPELPLNPDGSPTDPGDVALWCQAAVELINDLRAQVVGVVQRGEGGTEMFNRMVRLGNQAAENIVASAHEEAERIVSSAQTYADAAEAMPAGTAAHASSPGIGPSSELAGEVSFREEWERDASIDERLADRAFFEDGYDDPSRSWILADAG